jgi:hypothetical protein
MSNKSHDIYSIRFGGEKYFGSSGCNNGYTGTNDFMCIDEMDRSITGKGDVERKGHTEQTNKNLHRLSSSIRGSKLNRVKGFQYENNFAVDTMLKQLRGLPMRGYDVGGSKAGPVNKIDPGIYDDIKSSCVSCSKSDILSEESGDTMNLVVNQQEELSEEDVVPVESPDCSTVQLYNPQYGLNLIDLWRCNKQWILGLGICILLVFIIIILFAVMMKPKHKINIGVQPDSPVSSVQYPVDYTATAQ